MPGITFCAVVCMGLAPLALSAFSLLQDGDRGLASIAGITGTLCRLVAAKLVVALWAAL